MARQTHGQTSQSFHLKPLIKTEEIDASLKEVDKIAYALKIHPSFKETDCSTRCAVLLLDAALERDVQHGFDPESLHFYFWYMDSTWRMTVCMVAFAYMMVLPLWEAPCRPWNTAIATDVLLSCPSYERTALLLEVLLFLPLLSSDLLLKYRATGRSAFFGSKWNIAVLLALFICSVDCVIANFVVTTGWFFRPRFLRVFRSVIAMGSSKHSREAAVDGLWVVGRMLSYGAGLVLFTSIWGLVGFAMLGNLNGKVSHDNFSNGYASLRSAMTLQSANNYPDVLLPYFQTSPLFQLYFMGSVIVAFYGLSAGIIPGLVASFFLHCLEEDAKQQFCLERNVLLLAFASMKEGATTKTLSKEELTDLYVQFASLWHKHRWWDKQVKHFIHLWQGSVVRDETSPATESAIRIYNEIDKSGNGSVEAKEFLDFARDAMDREMLNNFCHADLTEHDKTDYEKKNETRRRLYRGISNSYSYAFVSFLLAMMTVVVQFQLLEFLLVLQVSYNDSQFVQFWYLDWAILVVAAVESVFSRFAQGRQSIITAVTSCSAIAGKVLAQLIFSICYHFEDMAAPLWPIARASGYGPWLRVALVLRILGPLQTFGIIPTSLETIGLFQVVQRDLVRLLACIMAFMAVFADIGQLFFVGKLSADNPNLARSDYAANSYFDFLNFDSWLQSLNSILMVMVGNDWTVYADGVSLACDSIYTWIFFILINFCFASVVVNIFLSMVMNLYNLALKERKNNHGQSILSSVSAMHRLVRDEFRADLGIENKDRVDFDEDEQ